jgi:ubiquinone/menaquinone biosynthesis C-methylase UbiE
MTTPSNDLETRLRGEQAFHDAKYSGDDLYPRHYKVNPTAQVYERMRDMLGNLENKRVLEYGCGEGWITRDLAARGAQVDAFDISEQGVHNTTEVLRKANLLERCTIRQMPAEQMSYPTGSFDLAVGFAILHHLDLEKALSELYRVLRPGGIAMFAEPLGSNPVINLYRRLTPQYRTVDERPLMLREFRKLVANFSSFTHHEYCLASLVSLAMLYVPVLNRGFEPVNRMLVRFDDWFLPKAGPLRNLAWYTVVVLQK